ncbi:hypothetical protein UFOVP660_29, partial [uncultured Caudovirales phage]
MNQCVPQRINILLPPNNKTNRLNSDSYDVNIGLDITHIHPIRANVSQNKHTFFYTSEK